MNIESLNLIVDINRDGVYSPWEIWETAKSVYRIPGNLVVEGLGNIPVVSDVLHIQASQATGYASLNGMLAAFLSLLFWLVAVISLLSLASPDDPESNVGRQPLQAGAGLESAAGDTTALSARPHASAGDDRLSVPGKTHKRRHRHHLTDTLIGHSK